MKKTNQLFRVLLATSVLLLSSCAMIQKLKCNKEYAAKKGMEDVEKGQLSQPGALEGNSCEGDYSASQFRNDYLYGFNQKKAEICQPSYAAKLGAEDGDAGLTNKPSLTKISVCSDVSGYKNFQTVYQTEFNKSYCSSTRAQRLGEADAKNFARNNFSGQFASCDGTTKSSYNTSYSTTLANMCTMNQATTKAMDDARAKRPSEATKYTVCPSNGSQLMAGYTEAFSKMAAQVAKEDADRAAAEKEAARQKQAADFMNSTSTASFYYGARPYSASCSIPQDKSHVQVVVTNPYADQILVQGNWRLQYYNNDFNKITEDNTMEAVLLTPNTKKSFQKLTLPRDASYCRAELVSTTSVQ
jgi:hypothetical protein